MFVRGLILSALCTISALALPANPVFPTGDVTCGSNVYTVSKVAAAVSSGFGHVGSPLGSNSYPHTFRNSERLKMGCSGSGSLYEYPILGSGTYSGGSPGADRVIFNTAGTYCAVVTHTGASGINAFVSCKNG